MKWSAEYNTGIEVIDDQHRRILDYINEIADFASVSIDFVMNIKQKLTENK